jgi:uncharacterized membrane protein YgcG
VESLRALFVSNKRALVNSTTRVMSVAAVTIAMDPLCDAALGRNGFLAKVTRGYLSHKSGGGGSGQNSPSSFLIDILEHCETPLQQMRRAGMGLLSKGLGSFGWGGAIGRWCL